MKTTEQFIDDARKVHGDRFDYSGADYCGAHKKVAIICREHGVFWQQATSHLRGIGCPTCKGVKLRAEHQKTTESFVAEAKAKHGDRYDYSKTVYAGARSKVLIVCREHGSFEQSAGSHTAGSGCPLCGNRLRSRGRRLATSDVLADATSVHDGKYDYALTEFSNLSDLVTIICPEHGAFRQTLQYHRNGSGCPTCARQAIAGAKRMTTETFLLKAKSVHAGKYQYDAVDYKNAMTKVEIKCPKHSSFFQEPYTHLQGCGCPNCGTTISKGEREVFDFIRNNCQSDAAQQFKIGRKAFDIRAGEVLIEYHGLYWHSNRNRTEAEAKALHLDRRLLANANGFRYIAIYEDEWRDRKAAVKAYLLNVFGKAPRVGAREFRIAEVATAEAKRFYEANHLLGAGAACGRHMALLDPAGGIAACMSIGRATEHRGQSSDSQSLSRFCTDGRNIAGAASRLFKAFGMTTPVVSYVDLDKFVGGVYSTLGFGNAQNIPPDYMTLWGDSSTNMVRRHKTATTRTALAKLPGFNAALTERENCNAMGIYRIYHSGRAKVTWVPTSEHKSFTPVEDLF